MNQRDTAKRVLEIESQAIRDLVPRIGASFEKAVTMILEGRGRVVVTGMGKSGIVGQKIAATLSSTGTPAVFMHPADAIHGDLGMVVAGDIVLAVSASGETEELLRLLETIRRLGVPLIAMTGEPDSTLARQSDAALDIAISREACPMGLVPTASTTAAVAMGDALAVALYTARGFSEDDFARTHPGGRLGRRLLRVEQIMHTGDALPRVGPDATVRDAVAEITAKTLGCTAVVAADGTLLGLFTDGDLRRLLGNSSGAGLLEQPVTARMTKMPATIARGELASRALAILEERRITAIPVVDPARRLEGIVHLHDLWRVQLF